MTPQKVYNPDSTGYYLMDGRALTDVDRAIVLDTCETLDEARAHFNDFGADTCIVDPRTWEVIDCLLWHTNEDKK